MKAVETQEDFDKELKDAGDKAVLVDFHATWCGPCKMIAPKLEEMAKNTPSMVFLKVDVDDAEEVSEKYEVKAMPTFMIFKNGEKQKELLGADVKKLEELINEYK